MMWIATFDQPQQCKLTFFYFVLTTASIVIFRKIVLTKENFLIHHAWHQNRRKIKHELNKYFIKISYCLDGDDGRMQTKGNFY